MGMRGLMIQMLKKIIGFVPIVFLVHVSMQVSTSRYVVFFYSFFRYKNY
jgi:hypothetical protein